MLILEDNPSDADLMVDALKLAGLDPQWERVDTEPEFAARLTPELDLILSDYTLPQFNGVEALRLVRSRGLDVPFILVSGSLGEDNAVEAMRNGADDYLLKDRMTRLGQAVLRALDKRRLNAEKSLAERALRESEERFRAAFEQAGVGIALRGTDPRDSRFLRVNQKLCDILGYTGDELLRLTSVDVTPPEDRALAIEYNEKLLRGEITASSREERCVRKDGRIIWTNVALAAVRGRDGPPSHVISVIEDITDRKEAEAKIIRLNRVYAVLSGINTLIVRVRNRDELLREACRIAVEHGNFAMAWIGMLDAATQDVTPVAWAGESAEALTRTKSSANEDSPRGKGAVGRAIRERRPVFNNDLTAHGFGGPRMQEVLRLGFQSIIALPLFDDQTVVGTLTMYAREPDFFDQEELRLLTELVGDISFALENISRQQKLDKLTRIRAVSSEINAALVRVRDQQELLDVACNIAVEQGGFPLAWIGMLDPATQDLKPAAMAGTVLEYAELLAPSIRADTPAGQGTNGRAFRENKPVVDNDMAVNPNTGFMRGEALKRGIQAAMSLPLLVGGAPVGVMGLYVKEKDYFDDEEASLLTEVAGNISFALEHINRQQKLDKLARIRAVSSEINAAIVRIRERKALLEETCRIASEQGKFEMVWIGTIDHEKQEVRPVAWTGFSAETAHSVSWASINAAKGTLGEAMLTRRPSVRNDIEAQLPAGKLREGAVEKGYHSSVCLPLVVNDSVTTLIVLFAAELGFFDKDELVLLDEVTSDISFALQNITKQDQLDYLSYYDPLTGLPNRTLYLERLGQRLEAAADGEHVVVILSDVQRLRMINETFGRQAGDEILKQIARRLAEFVRNPESLARIAADHFAIFVPEVKDIGEVARRIEQWRVESLRNSFSVAGRELTLAYTLGAAVYPEDGKDAESLLANAEAALKKAKAAGESLLFYEPSINARVAESLELENRLRRALEKEQFVLHYQPKVELASGRVCGLEALIRWNDPETGLVPPMKFIPLLEETGMIIDVGRWAIRQALRDYREWIERGLQPPRIAVNVSPIQLRQKDFVEVMRDAIGSAAGFHGLDLEITESQIMEDIAGNIVKLRAIRDMGAKIAIDDFGTGYSSLGYLAKLPVNALKIDRSFIITMVNEPDSMTIVSAIISLAHALNLTVIAEGVDAEEQRKVLRLLKCDEMQGYLFSKPLPAAEIDPLLRTPA